jgi:hypothetical protein
MTAEQLHLFEDPNASSQPSGEFDAEAFAAKVAASADTDERRLSLLKTYNKVAAHLGLITEKDVHPEAEVQTTVTEAAGSAVVATEAVAVPVDDTPRDENGRVILGGRAIRTREAYERGETPEVRPVQMHEPFAGYGNPEGRSHDAFVKQMQDLLKPQESR